ncbi:MAG: hypothetical protein COY40_04125 [Alphaproteobacteria bacterium CG_4_10_14_0_8_um_filter_53_9]|nr:MAG: hypothetical protein COY40_04125 [Alphaproteobacteria bacterium CG_4_10_14_0_8_um_filter_53_9]
MRVPSRCGPKAPARTCAHPQSIRGRDRKTPRVSVVQAAQQGFAAVAGHMPWAIPALLSLMGGIWASFVGCARGRRGQGQSLRYPPSHCDTCKKNLSAIDLVPLFSWVFLRGRCRRCGAPIGWQAMVLEASCMAVPLAAWFVVSPLMAVGVSVAFWGGVGVWGLTQGQKR